MSQNLFTLFAVIDTESWSIDQIRTWADTLILEAASPASWLLKLSLAQSLHDAAEIVREAVRERGVMLPDDIGALMVGLLCRRLRQGSLDREQFIAQVSDVVDAYELPSLRVDEWNRWIVADAEPPPAWQALLRDLEDRATAALVELEDIARVKDDPLFRD